MVSSVLIVIVNFRTPDLTIDCLRSIAGERGSSPPLRVAIVDNASGDGSAARLASAIAAGAWQGWVSLHASERNGGFAAGNNMAIRAELRRAPADQATYVMLLNPDTVVRPGAVAELARFMEARPEVGIAGSRIENQDGRAQGSARRFPSPLGELEGAARLGPVTRILRRHAVPMREGDAPMRCESVSGAAMMIRTELFRSVGLLDEGYFLYYEETDFCHRVVRAGSQVWFVPGSRVLHFEGSSTGIGKRNRRRPRYWYESRRRFFVKAHGAGGWLLADCCWALGRLIWTVQKLSGFVRCWDEDPRGFARDLLVGDWEAVTDGSWRKIGEGAPGPAGPGPRTGGS